jgi:intracellular sulfur oxidation DsrE/DsrF family protein
MPFPTPVLTPRRSFLSRMAAAAAAFGVASLPGSAAAEPTAFRGVADDEPWMKKITGSQRVIFHSHEPTNGQALTWARTYLDAQKNAYGRADSECCVVVGLNGKSIGLTFNDALWAKYPIAQAMTMSGTQNPNGPAASNAIAQLQARGVIILVCQNSLRASGQRFLPESARGDAAARSAFADEARANLLPGVEVVPAMVATLQMAQDRGCRYVYAGG